MLQHPLKKRLYLLFGFLAFASVTGIAAWYWQRPSPERDLNSASYSTLVSLTRRQPKNAKAYYYLGRKLQSLGFPQDAYTALMHAATLAPNDSEIWVAASAASGPIDNGQTAVNALSEFVKRNPTDADATFALANLLAKMHQFKRARDLYRIVLNQRPSDAEAWHKYGKTLVNDPAHKADAVDAYSKAVKLEPDNLLYVLDLADAQSQIQMARDAEQSYRSAIAIAPDDVGTCTAAGHFFVSQPTGSPLRAEGEQLLEKAVSLDPDNMEARLNLGNALADSGNFKEAAPNLEMVVKYNPTQAEDWYALARVYQRMNDSRAAATLAWAEKLRKNAVALNAAQARAAANPNDPQLSLTLARLYLENGDIPNALTAYNTSVRLAPSDTAIRQELDAVTARLRSGNTAATSNSSVPDISHSDLETHGTLGAP